MVWFLGPHSTMALYLDPLGTPYLIRVPAGFWSTWFGGGGYRLYLGGRLPEIFLTNELIVSLEELLDALVFIRYIGYDICICIYIYRYFFIYIYIHVCECVCLHFGWPHAPRVQGVPAACRRWF